MSARVFFSGANAPCGFVNKFEYILPSDAARRVYLIKGGSGVGKSTFMRRIAARYEGMGMYAEHFNCSSDPQSLDGLAIPELGAAIMDATPPHAMEPSMSGVRDFILNLGEYLDEDKLAPRRAELERALPARSACFRRAYACMRAALPLYEDAGRIASGCLKTADRLAAELNELIPPASPDGADRPPWHRSGIRRLFAEAVTPAGAVSVLAALREKLCIRVKLPWGCDASQTLEGMAAAHAQKGESAVLLMNPMLPARALHLLLPDAGALISADGGILERDMAFDAEMQGGTGHMDSAGLSAAAFDRREYMRLMAEAVAELARAKGIHAKVESMYASAMDFEAVDRLINGVFRELDTLLPLNRA